MKVFIYIVLSQSQVGFINQDPTVDYQNNLGGVKEAQFLICICSISIQHLRGNSYQLNELVQYLECSFVILGSRCHLQVL